MKAFILITLALIIVLLPGDCLLGKIRNGYERKLSQARFTFERLQTALTNGEHLPPGERRALKEQMNSALAVITLYELTDEMINEMKIISPRTFYLNDTITDRKGRPTDIYVKLIPKSNARINLMGASYVWPSDSDADLNCSEYGERSVAIEIWMCANALLLLSHELGHVNYIIPNLAGYFDFYNRTYSSLKGAMHYIGHNRNDLSGKSADTFLDMFYQDRKRHVRNGGPRPSSPLARINHVKRSIRNDEQYARNASNPSLLPPSTVTVNGMQWADCDR